MPRDALRIGLVVDGTQVPAWIAALVLALNNSESAAIARVVYAAEDAAPLSLDAPLYEQLDRLLFARGEDPLRPVALPDLASLPTEGRVDLQLHLSISPPQYDEDAELGTWYFHPDLLLGTASWAPVAAQSTVASADLFARWQNDEYALYSGHTAVHTFSIRRTNQRLYWLASAAAVRCIEQLCTHPSPARYYARNGTPTVPPAPAPSAPFTLRPFIASTWRRAWTDLSQRTEWHIRYGRTADDHLPSDFDAFLPLQAASHTYWADPFPFVHEKNLYLFFEVYDQRKKKGHIAVMPFGEQGPSGPAVRALETPEHLSYPLVFAHEGIIYMMPESSERGTVDLYRCQRFPDKWTYDRTLLHDLYAVDSTLCYHDNWWWIFTCQAAHPNAPARDELFLYYADSPLSAHWTPHPMNPIIADVRHARPAGRIFELDGRTVRPAQDCSQRYGYGIHLREIVVWNREDYSERALKSYLPQGGRVGMHTFNRSGSWTFVDIKLRKRRWL